MTNAVTFTYQQTSLIEDKLIVSLLEKCKPYIHTLGNIVAQGGYDAPEGTLNLPQDQLMKNTVQELAKVTVTQKLKYMFVIGIGGSNLGARAIYSALRGPLAMYDQSFPKLLFADTVSSTLLLQMKALIENNVADKDEVLLNIISKSGTTMETIANFDVLYGTLSKKFGDSSSRVIVTTDKDSALWQLAKEKGFSTLEIPKKVGGRYSVFSPCGLFPLAMTGIDIGALLEGASQGMKIGTSSPIDKNLSALSACLIFAHWQQGVRIHDTFFFNPELEDVGKWYRQLMGESIGKEKNLEGTIVNVGITPTVSIGSTDLHSMAQLYFGGPKDKFFTLIKAPSIETVSVEKEFSHLAEGIQNKTLSQLMDAIYGGVRQTFLTRTIPFIELSLSNIDENSLGQLLQMKMIEIMCLAYLLDINAFDQPNVEEYKTETKKILSI